ncbi:MAG TPA: hypothetical protein PK759_01260 [Spirochaetales bacterium]|nr:hypothetical protein [Spirochaetales bacterium]HPS14407.1 hypothetical protein [Spirochaetales bacterium]
MVSKRTIKNGFILGAAGLAASWILARSLFSDPYYVEWLTVATMAIYFLIAWLIHLRNDGIMKARVEPRQKDLQTRQQLKESQAPEKDLRSQTPPREQSQAPKVFLLGAAFLALASFVQYFCFGLGRSFGG